jgi:predicted dehydrogenase
VDGVKLVGVADRSPDVLDRAEHLLGVGAHSTLQRLLDAARPEVVVLATPASSRAELTERASQCPSVRAIVAEKPMAGTLAEAQRMFRACEARGILLLVSHQLRFCPEFLAMKAAIDGGELGALEFLRGSCYGNLLNQGPHILDAIRWFAGGRRILWVMSQRSDDPLLLARQARGDRGYWEDASHPAPMWMTHHLAFEGGLRATMETGLLYQPSRKFVDDWLQKRVTAIGSGGFAESQAAGQFKLLSAGRGGWTTLEGSPEVYAAATKAFHEELRDAVQRGVPHRNDARDAIKTLEALVACAQSAVDGGLVSLPLEPHRDPLSELQGLRHSARHPVSPGRMGQSPGGPTPPRSDSLQLDVSVIIALPDHRGHALDCVESWVRGQTYRRDRFEVIVVTDGSDGALEARVKELLGPGDQMLCHATANELLLYHLGAQKARGNLLFFTEPHCIAEAECLEELVKFFATHDYDGACCRSVGICSNTMARMEERLFEEGFRAFSRRGDWRKVILRGFAIYRDVYFQEGGFEVEFGRFAEWAFAARLHSRGRKLGYAPGPAVRHAYTSSFRELVPPVREFSWGECAYRASHPAEYCERYFGHAQEWAQRGWFRPGLARSACRAILGSLRAATRGRGGRRSMLWAQGKALLRLLPMGLLGPRSKVVAAAAAVWTARARCAIWRFHIPRLYRAYCDAYERVVRYSRIAFVAQDLPTSVSEVPEVCRVRPAEILESCLVGFQAIEWSNGESFRWAGPVAILRLRVPRGAYHVEIDTRSLRDGGVPLRLSVFFNRTMIPPASVGMRDGVVSFPISRSMFSPSPEQLLILTCNPVRPWKSGSPDRRELGLPIFSIAFTSHRQDTGSDGDAVPPPVTAGAFAGFVGARPG